MTDFSSVEAAARYDGEKTSLVDAPGPNSPHSRAWASNGSSSTRICQALPSAV